MGLPERAHRPRRQLGSGPLGSLSGTLPTQPAQHWASRACSLRCRRPRPWAAFPEAAFSGQSVSPPLQCCPRASASSPGDRRRPRWCAAPGFDSSGQACRTAGARRCPGKGAASSGVGAAEVARPAVPQASPLRPLPATCSRSQRHGGNHGTAVGQRPGHGPVQRKQRRGGPHFCEAARHAARESSAVSSSWRSRPSVGGCARVMDAGGPQQMCWGFKTAPRRDD